MNTLTIISDHFIFRPHWTQGVAATTDQTSHTTCNPVQRASGHASWLNQEIPDMCTKVRRGVYFFSSRENVHTPRQTICDILRAAGIQTKRDGKEHRDFHTYVHSSLNSTKHVQVLCWAHANSAAKYIFGCCREDMKLSFLGRIHPLRSSLCTLLISEEWFMGT